MLDKFRSLYFSLVFNYPLFLLAGVVVIAAALASQLPKLHIDASSDALTLEYDKDLDTFREMSKRYQSGDFLVVTYKPNDDLMSDKSLANLKNLRDELLQVEGVASANSILDVPLLYSPKISVLDLVGGINTLLDEGVERELARKEFTQSPIYKNMLLGPDGKTTAILLNLELDETFIGLVRERDALRLKQSQEGLNDTEQVRLQVVSEEFLAYRTNAASKSHERVQQVRDVVAKYQDKAQIYLGGVSMIAADMVDFIASDIVVFGIGIIVFIIIILTVIFRRWQFVALPLLSCFMVLIIMLGFLAAIDWRLTVISSNFVALLLIVSLALTIHLIVRYREAVSLQPTADKQQWIREAVEAMAKPCMFTVLTTMVAFVSLVVSGIRPVIDFGWMMTIGLGIAFVLAFIVIPSGLMLLPATTVTQREDKSVAFTLIFSRFTERRGTLIIVVGIAAAIFSAIGISRLEVENRFIDYFHSSTEIHQGMLVIDQQLGGTITLDILLTHPKPTVEIEGSDDPFGEEGDPFAEADPFGEDFSADPFAEDPFAENTTSQASVTVELSDSDWFTQAGFEKIGRLHNFLEQLPEVGKVQSLATAYQVATDLTGRSLSDFELALMAKALPDDIVDFLVKPYLNTEHNQTRITLRAKETDPQLKRAELIKKIRRFVVDEMGVETNHVEITGVLVLYNNMLQSLFKSQILTIGAVFIGILLMFLVLFRSLLLSFIALVPNILAALAVVGGMGLIGIPLDMMTITIAAIAVGMGVDNAIHYIYRFRREFSKKGNYIQAMHGSHGSIGKAMYYTSITIIVGFSILTLSKFIPSIYFGLLTGLAMFAAVLASLTLLPKLLLVFKPLGPETEH